VSRCTLCGKRIWSLAAHTVHPYCYLSGELARVEKAALDAKLAGESALKIAENPAQPQLPADMTEALTQLRKTLQFRLEWMRAETKNTDLALGWNTATLLTLAEINQLLNGETPWKENSDSPGETLRRSAPLGEKEIKGTQ